MFWKQVIAMPVHLYEYESHRIIQLKRVNVGKKTFFFKVNVNYMQIKCLFRKNKKREKLK